jgi:penicillin amidase
LRALIRSWLPAAKPIDPAIVKLLTDWDGRVGRDRPEPLIATLWMSRTAALLLGTRLGRSYNDWWFWDGQALRRLLADPKWCVPLSCDALLAKSLQDVVAELRDRLGANPATWKWGDLHRMHFRHPVFRGVPFLSDRLDPDLATDGDEFTVNRGVPVEAFGKLDLPDVHGPTMRLIVDLADPMQAVATLAGGESGNPLSRNYADWLIDWRDGRYRTIVQPPVHTLTLMPRR